MNLQIDVERVLLAHKAVRAELLAERAPGGYWPGQLGSSPLATAAAVSALVAAHHQDSDDVLREFDARDSQVIERLVQGDLSELLLESVHWLARRQNDDGGWGDCDGAESDIAATLLVQAAFRLTGIPAKYADLMVRADQFVSTQGGAAGLRRRHGKDKPFYAAIMANCALADMAPWRQVPTQAFERFCLPQRWQREIHTPAARYASPLVMAVGLAKFHHDPPRNPIMRLLRRSLRNKTLAGLEQSQAADDSYLASPLVTSFVVMSLASLGCQEHAIVERGIEFLLSSVRADASWAVTVNLATTNTALAVESLSAGQRRRRNHDTVAAHSAHWQDTATANDVETELTSSHEVAQSDHAVTHGDTADENAILNDQCLEWLHNSQQLAPNKLTEMPAGGWGSSDAPGALPNTSATASVLLALAEWCRRDVSVYRARVERAVTLGVTWLLELQGGDGGWPTYQSDDSSQQFDDSGIDLTAQALRALAVWQRFWKTNAKLISHAAHSSLSARIGPAVERAMQFLESQQREDGSLIPVWFGNEHQADDENPVLGTAQVLAACADLERLDSKLANRAAAWLVAAQHSGGGWGPPRAPVDYSGTEKEVGLRSWRENDALAKFCSVEESSAAISALLPLAEVNPLFERSVSRGLTWLANAVEQDAHRRPAVLGFYFSRIWYYERLYPLAFAAGALSRAVGALAPSASAETALR